MKLIVFFVVLFWSGSHALACDIISQSVAINGADISKQIPDIQKNISKVWKMVLEVTNTDCSSIKPPTVELSSFVTEKQRPEWTKWQEQWVKKYSDADFYKDGYEKEVAIAYHYTHTNKVQINHEHEHGFVEWAMNLNRKSEWASPLAKKEKKGDVQVNSEGKILKAQHHGFGYFYLGHEFLHYVLEKKGVNADDQHCLMLKKEGNKDNMETELAKKLIAEDLTFAFIIQVAIRTEEYVFAGQCKN